MNFVNIYMYIYAILKPYYIRKSGTLQVADCFVLLAFITLILIQIKGKFRAHPHNIKKIKPLVLFVLFTLLINTIYFFIYNTKDFCISSLQYIFILIGIYTFYNVLDCDRFLSNINKILKLNIVIQLVICLLGYGRYYTPTRYMGTFNDPNQFAFYIFLTYMITIIINKIEGKKHKYHGILLLIVAFLIIKSASTGSAMGFAIYVLLSVLANFKHVIIYLKKYKTILFVLNIGLIVILIFFCLLYNTDEKFKSKIDEKVNNFASSAIVERIVEKIIMTKDNNKGISLIEDRCIDKIIYYPEYLLFGAGQGYYNRFKLAKFAKNEIHSTLLGILFYYGIIPFTFLMYWLWINLKNLKFKECIPYIAILFESFILNNQRQLLLWFMIILACRFVNGKGEKKHV